MNPATLYGHVCEIPLGSKIYFVVVDTDMWVYLYSHSELKDIQIFLLQSPGRAT